MLLQIERTSASESFVYPNRIYLIHTLSDITSGTSMSESNLPEWEQLLSAAAHLQQILPDATLVGGTAIAIFTQHRLSRDADHVLPDLRHKLQLLQSSSSSVCKLILISHTGFYLSGKRSLTPLFET